MKLFRKFLNKKINKKFYKSLVFQSSMTFLVSLEILTIFIVYLSNLNYLDNLKVSALDKINYIRIDQEDQIKKWLLKEQNTSFEISNSSEIRLRVESLNNNKGNEIETNRSRQTLKSLFEKNIRSNQKISTMLLFDSKGKVIAYADDLALQKSDSSYEKIQGMIKNSNLYIKGKENSPSIPFFYLTINDNQPYIAFVNPIFDGLGNKFNLLINVKTEQLNQLVISNNLKTETDTYLIGSLNKSSFLVFGEMQGLVSKNNVPENLVIENALSKQTGSGFYKNYAATDVIGSYSWFTPLNITIISEVNQDKSLASSNRVFRNMILISSILVIIVTFIFYFLVKYRMQTITRISEIALSVSQDGFDTRFPTSYHDEIGNLGIALNHMLSRFRRFRQQVLEPKDISINNEIDQSGELLHSFIELTSEGFTFLDSNNLILKINSNFAEIISISIADSLGVSHEEIFPQELSKAIKTMESDSQETYQIKFSIPYQGTYIAFLSNVIRKVATDTNQIHSLGKIIVIYTEDKANNLVKLANKYPLIDIGVTNSSIKRKQELSQKLGMPMISLLGFLKLTKKKLEETIFPKLVSTDIKTLKNVQQIEQNLESMIAEGTQLAKSIREAFQDEEVSQEVQANKLLQQESKFSIAKVLENIATKAEELFVSKSGKLILENNLGSAEIKANRDQVEHMINLLLNRVVHNKEFRTALIQAKVVDGRVVIVMGKISSLLTRSQISSTLSKLTSPSHLQAQSAPLTKGMGLLNIQKMLNECGGSIAVQWIDSNRESYKFYVLSFPALP